MVQCRRVLHRGHEPLGAAPPARPLAVRFQHALHRHRTVREQPAGRRPFRPPGKDRRKALPGPPGPGRAHRRGPAPDPTVGVRAPAMLPPGPSAGTAHRSGPAGNPPGPAAQGVPPAFRERHGPDRAARAGAPPGGQLGTAPASRRPMAQAGPVRPGEGPPQDRADATGRLPTVRDALRRHARGPGGKPLDTDAGKWDGPVAADDPADVGQAGIRRPAYDAVAGTGLDPRRRQDGPAGDAVPLRADPVPDLPARRTPPALRMVRPDHRLPAAAVIRARHRVGRQRTEVPERAGDRPVGKVRRGSRARAGLQRLRLRQADVQRVRGPGQQRPRRSQAAPPGGTAPVLAVDRPAGQRAPRQPAAPAGRREPVHRL